MNQNHAISLFIPKSAAQIDDLFKPSFKTMSKVNSRLPWLQPGDRFPPTEAAWTDKDPAPGLLAAGATLDTQTLIDAYSHGIFPWFSDGQPVLWWSPNPRMVLKCDDFRLHRSLRKTLARFEADSASEIRIDHSFDQVIRACASQPRDGQAGTWIVEEMVEAYCLLHRQGYAHSVETWINGRLTGGLYCVNLGGMVFGESMFSHATDASKIALAALVAFCRSQGISMIDCQQNTRHLSSLGAAEISRDDFKKHLEKTTSKPAPDWHVSRLLWRDLQCETSVTSIDAP